MKKEKIKNIVLIIVVAVISSTITSFATSNYLFDSVDVKYDNSNGVQAETVQGAIDELYACASDYSEIKSYFKNGTSSEFDGNWLNVGKNRTSSTIGDVNPGIRLLYNNESMGSFFYHSNENITYLSANDGTSNGSGQGTLDLIGNPVTVNGKGIEIKSKTVTIGNVTLSANGYADISSSRPSDMNNFLFTSINYWSEVNPKSAFNIDVYGRWILGSPNQVISGLKVTYFYTD